jgi:hypothetical protein
MKKETDIIGTERITGDLQNLSCLLGTLTHKMLGKKAFAEADVLCHWTEIVGEETAAYTQPVKISFKKGERTGGVLHLETAGGAFALELQLKSKILISKVNTFFGYEAVKDLKIVQNPMAFQNLQKSTHNCEKMLVTPEEETYIESLSENIGNSELKAALCRLGQAVVSHNKEGSANHGSRKDY